MELISLRCPNCGGDLKFEDSMEFGFCQYCGNKVMIPRATPSQTVNLLSDTTKFFFMVYYKGEQVQHAIKDEVTIKVKYRNNAASGDPMPLGIEISTNGIAIENKFKLPVNVGIGNMQISGIGSSLSLSKEQKLNVNINGAEMSTNLSRIFYGDLISLGNIILRVQPMPAD